MAAKKKQVKQTRTPRAPKVDQTAELVKAVNRVGDLLEGMITQFRENVVKIAESALNTEMVASLSTATQTVHNAVEELALRTNQHEAAIKELLERTAVKTPPPAPPPLSTPMGTLVPPPPTPEATPFGGAVDNQNAEPTASTTPGIVQF